jgi:hypothetical protein
MSVGQKVSLHGARFSEHTKTGEFVPKPLSCVSKFFVATHLNTIASRTRLSHDGTHLYQQTVQKLVQMHNKPFSFGGNDVVNSGTAPKLNIWFLIFIPDNTETNTCTRCPRRNVPDFGRVFLTAREKCGLLAGRCTLPVSRQPYLCPSSSVVSYYGNLAGSLPSVSVQSEREVVRTSNTRENILRVWCLEH